MARITAQELLDKQNDALTNMRNIIDLAKREDREMTDAEQTSADTYEKEFKDLHGKYKAKLKQEEQEQFLTEQTKQLDKPANERRTTPHTSETSQLQQDRYARWNPLKESEPSCRHARYNERQYRREPNLTNASSEYSQAFERYLIAGDRSQVLQTDDDTRGGYLQPTESFMEGLLKEVDDATWIYRLARTIFVRQSRQLGIRKLTRKMSTWAKGAELSDAADNEDASIAFGKKVLTPSYYTGSARISRDLIRVASLDIESLVYSEFARDLAYVIEQEAITGDGKEGILGCMVASNDGISTARDVSTNTTTTTFKPEALYDAKYALKPQYRNRARWMFHRNRILELAKMRTNVGGAGTGEFLWQPNFRVGEPETVAGLPVDENEFFPSATGAGLYYGMLATWENYLFAIGLDMELLRLMEVKASKNQIQYVGRIKIDGMPILEEGFSRLQYAAS